MHFTNSSKHLASTIKHLKRLLPKAAILAGLLSAFLPQSPCNAQSAFSITHTKLKKDTVIVASNTAGWFVTEDLFNSDKTVILHGPSNYQRDISSFVPAASEDMTISDGFVTAIDKNGGVYFGQNVFARRQSRRTIILSHVGDEVKKLSLDSAALTPILSYRSTSKDTGSSHQLNINGDLIQFHYTNQNGATAMTLNKQLNGVATSQSLTIPGETRGRNQHVEIILKDSGRFLIFRTSNTLKHKSPRGAKGLHLRLKNKGREAITAICSGHLASSDTKCISEDKLKEINAARLSVSQMTSADTINSSFTLTKHGPRLKTFALLDTDTFESQASFSVPSWIDSGRISITSDGSLAAITNKPMGRAKSIKISINPVAGEKLEFLCPLEKKVAFMFGISQLIPLEQGKLMVMVSGQDANDLLTLTPIIPPLAAANGTQDLCMPSN
jgi:hypothetical protein